MVAIAASTTLATIDASIVNVAFPTLVAELETSFNVIQWVALGYLLTIATLTLGMGRFGDVVGKKRPFLAGMALFVVASVACGLVPSVSWLIAFRVLQATGSVLILALGAAILVEAFPPSERGKALGWIGTAVSLGIVSGPVIGGLLISSFGWRAIFFVNVPVGIVALYLANRYIPDTPAIKGQKFDVVGALLMSMSLFAFSLALTLGQDQGFTSAPILASFIIFATTAIAFVFVELRLEVPMLQLRLFRNPMLSVSVATGFLAFVCLAATFLLMPFYLEGVLGFAVGTVGLLMGVAPLMMGLSSPIAGTLSDRFGVRPVTLVGLAVIASAYFAYLTFDTDTTALHFISLAAPLGIGIGIFNSPNNSGIMSSVPPEYMGVGGGLLTITRLLGQITGIAVLGSVWATRVATVNGGALPEGGASAAAPTAQMAGLHTVFLVAGAVMSAAFVVGAWGFGQERRERRSTVSLPAEA